MSESGPTHQFNNVVLSGTRNAVRALPHSGLNAAADTRAQSVGQLKVSPAGFQWRKTEGGKEASVAKDGACAACPNRAATPRWPRSPCCARIACCVSTAVRGCARLVAPPAWFPPRA